ncbi:MAG: FAD-dependent oxidoreductase [Candidatus Atribacteria bacterium]|nr:FAD-dependent oxidoreductase [Candidatus Atribacteria bacterium]
MNKEIIETDVAVIGAGPGGIAAAVSAARQGVRVTLVERQGYLGGQLSSGLPFLAFFDTHQKRIVGGLAQEMVDRLATLNFGTVGHRYCPHHLSTTSINQFYTRIICFQWIKECGIQLLMHCELSDAKVTNGRLQWVTATGKGMTFEIRAKVYIDGTGDGDLGYITGATYEKGHILQPPTLMFNLGGVNFKHFIDYIAAHPEELLYNVRPDTPSEYNADFFRDNPGHVFVGLNATVEKLREQGRCPIDRDTIIYIRLPIPDHVAVNSIRILNCDGSNIHDLSRAEMEGHLQIIPLIEMFRNYVPGFEDCYLTYIHPTIGVRESRRIMGIKKLSQGDVLSGIIPTDAVAIFSYFIDIHSGKEYTTYVKRIKEPYGVPYGCTVSKDIQGLMMTGRCISVDAIALGSSRIMTLCMAIGEGAGVGAALAVKQGIEPADVDTNELREILRKNGAILHT